MKDIIKSEMVKAMKSKDTQRLGVIRLINGKVSDYIKENGSEDNVVSVLDSMVKERNKSISAYTEAGRSDLSEVEQYEIDVISEFLPKRMSIAEITIIANEVITQMGASSMKDMGRVIGNLKGTLGESATPSDIATVVKQILSN